MQLNEKIRDIRTTLGLSVSEVAKRAGMAQATLSQLELGRRKLKDYQIRAIAQAMGVPEKDLYDYADPPDEIYDVLQIKEKIEIRLEIPKYRIRAKIIMPYIRPILEGSENVQQHVLLMTPDQKQEVAEALDYDVDALFMKTYPGPDLRGYHLSEAQKHLIEETLRVHDLDYETVEQLLKIIKDPKLLAAFTTILSSR